MPTEFNPRLHEFKAFGLEASGCGSGGNDAQAILTQLSMICNRRSGVTRKTSRILLKMNVEIARYNADAILSRKLDPDELIDTKATQCDARLERQSVQAAQEIISDPFASPARKRLVRNLACFVSCVSLNLKISSLKSNRLQRPDIWTRSELFLVKPKVFFAKDILRIRDT